MTILKYINKTLTMGIDYAIHSCENPNKQLVGEDFLKSNTILFEIEWAEILHRIGYDLSIKYCQDDTIWSLDEIKEISRYLNEIWSTYLCWCPAKNINMYEPLDKDDIDYFRKNIKDFLILKMFFEKLIVDKCYISVF